MASTPLFAGGSRCRSGEVTSQTVASRSPLPQASVLPPGVAATDQVPEPGGAVLAGAGERPPVGGERECIDRLGVVSDHEHDTTLTTKRLRSKPVRRRGQWPAGVSAL